MHTIGQHLANRLGTMAALREVVGRIGPRGAKAFGRALLAVGQRHVAVAERMIELADEKAGRESEPEKRHSGRYNTEQSR